ncbi:MAG: hypothetical protein ABI193_06780 [Minicystis sp.]
MDTSSMLSSARPAIFGVISGIACVFSTAGCVATVRSDPPVVYAETDTEVVYTESAPVDVETYPVEYYGGVNVYLVDGRWYRRSGSRWQTYRAEPVELRRRRTVIEHRAPRPGPPPHDNRNGDKHDKNNDKHDKNNDDHGNHH